MQDNQNTLHSDDAAYRKRLMIFLSVATFFEGFDQMAIAQLLTNLRADFDLNERSIGALVAFVNVGTVLAYWLVRHADRVGRKPVLDVTIAGYTVASFLSGLAPNVYAFAALQMIGRIFLIGEWAVSTVFAAEEFPANERGKSIGVINAFGALGAVICAAIVPQLVKAPWGWRTVYFAGTVPLIALAFARRGLRETTRFSALPIEQRKPASLMTIFYTPYKGRMLKLALIWGLTYLCTQTAITFFKPHVVEELHMTPERAGLLISIGAVVSMPAVFFVGRMMDRLGRHKAAALVFLSAALGCLGAYTAHGMVALTISIILAIFGASAVLPVLNAYGTELFPTHLRSESFAWSNNILGRIGYVVAPLFVGELAKTFGWGWSVSLTAFGPLAALGLIWLWLPETKGQELEQTAQL